MTLSSETVLQYKNMIPCKSTIAKEKKKGLSPFSMGAFNDRLCIWLDYIYLVDLKSLRFLQWIRDIMQVLLYGIFLVLIYENYIYAS